MGDYLQTQLMRSVPLPMEQLPVRSRGRRGGGQRGYRTNPPAGWTEAEWDAHLVRLAELAIERKELRETPPSAAA